MVDNLSSPNGVPSGQQSGTTNQGGGTSPAQSSYSVFAPQQQSPQDAGTQSQQEEGKHITLDDMYGPSQPGELQQQAQQAPPQESASSDSSQEQQSSTQHPVEPAYNVFAPQTQQSPQQSVSAPQSTASAEEVGDTADGGYDEEDEGGFHIPKFIKLFVGGFIVLVIAILVIGAGYLVAHNQNTGSGGSSNGKVTLTYWGLWEDNSIMDQIFADFEKQHPNISVSYVRQDPKDYVQRLVTRMKNGDGPDLFRLHNTWIGPLQSILLPLPTSVIDPKKIDSIYPQVVKNDMTLNGVVYGLPLEMDALSLFINDDIFSHAGATVPVTWDDFITVAKALTVKDPNGHIQTAGAAIGTYDNITHAPDIMSLLLLQNSADLLKLKDSQNAQDALTFYTSFATGDSNVWDATLDNSLLAFERGKLAMYFGYSYDIFAIQTASPALHFSIHPVPHLPGKNMTIASYWAEAVSNRSKHPKEALELMQYLAQKDTQEKIYTEEAKSRAFGEPYARTDLAQSLLNNNRIGPLVAQFKNAQSSFFVDGTYFTNYNGALDQYLGNAINSVVKDNIPVDSATATLNDGVSQVTSQYAPQATQ